MTILSLLYLFIMNYCKIAYVIIWFMRKFTISISLPFTKLHAFYDLTWINSSKVIRDLVVCKMLWEIGPEWCDDVEERVVYMI